MSELDGWVACPRCRADLAGSPGRVECPVCGFVAYANPKPAVSAVCVDERGRVLLTRRAVAPAVGTWDLPGGFLDEHEHPLDALRRELREETGLEVEPRDFLGIWMDDYGGDSTARSILSVVYTARVAGGEARAADDVSELRWFASDELPAPEEFGFRCVALALQAWRDEHA